MKLADAKKLKPGDTIWVIRWDGIIAKSQTVAHHSTQKVVYCNKYICHKRYSDSKFEPLSEIKDVFLTEAEAIQFKQKQEITIILNDIKNCEEDITETQDELQRLEELRHELYGKLNKLEGKD